MENKPEFDKNFFEQLLNKKLKPTLFKKYIKLLFINMNNGCFSEFKYNEDKGLKLDLFITYRVIDNFNDGNKKKNKPKKGVKVTEKRVIELINEHVPKIIDERVPKIINEMVPKIIDERVPKIINEMVPKIIDEHVPKIINEMVPKIIDERVPKIINEMVPKIIDERVPKIINEMVMPMFGQVFNMLEKINQTLIEIKEEIREIKECPTIKKELVEIRKNKKMDTN